MNKHRTSKATQGQHKDTQCADSTYTPDGQLCTLTAKNPTTGDQTTRYVYGTTLSDSGIARRDLLRAEIYPDSDDLSDPLRDGPDEIYDRVERFNSILAGHGVKL